jgi:carbamoyltransferase
VASVLGINAAFHDPSSALVIDGRIAAAAEEERFTRRKHGKEPVSFSTWELPERSARWCLEHAGIEPRQLDAVAYSYDPELAPPRQLDVTADTWESLRTLYVERAPLFLKTALPGLDPGVVRFVPHHLAHAASAYLAGPFESCAALVLDGRGESASHLAGQVRDGRLQPLAAQPLPDSLGLVYESLTQHLGFRRASDEYKVMALAAYGEPRFLPELQAAIRATGDGGFQARPLDWERFASPADGETLEQAHADLAASVQRRLEEVLLELARWLHERTGERDLALAGGVALNCVANSRLWREGPFERIWVQPAAGDAGTALGAALYVAQALGDQVEPMRTAALGRGWEERELARWLSGAKVIFDRPHDLAAEVAQALARNEVVAWFQGRAEFGPRALGHRSLLADPREAENLERLNDIKGREQFRPVAPMVPVARAPEIFNAGPLPSPYMLFTHRVNPKWIEQIPGAVHVDGTARIQTVDPAAEPLVARMLGEFERLTSVPVVINTSLNVAGRPIVDDPRDALECFGSAPIDLLAIGPFVVRRLPRVPDARRRPEPALA